MTRNEFTKAAAMTVGNLSAAATAAGGKYALSDNRETPDTLEVLYEYPASPVSGQQFVVRFSYRNANGRGPEGRRNGMQFFGTDGTLCIDRSGFALWRENSTAVMKGKATTPREESALCQPHVMNFLECMRSRGKTNSDVETMHRSTSAPIIGNIAYRLGRKVRWDRDAEKFIGDSEANERLTKQYRKPWLLPEG